jgi:alpha-D-xyloside xylohydrolase
MMKVLFLLIIALLPPLCEGQVIKDLKYLSDRIEIALPEGTLSICPLTDNAVRIRFLKDVEVRVPEFVFTSGTRTPRFTVSNLPSRLEVRVRNMVVALDKQDGRLSFEDSSGKMFLSEKAGTRRLTHDSVMGEPCFVAEQSFESPADEYLFGLGQFQDGHYNVKGVSRRLTQVNSQIAIPFVYSSKGYGLLWHQYGLTDFNPADNAVPLVKQVQSSAIGEKTAEVTSTSGTVRISQNQTLYTGTLVVPEGGVYSVFLDLGDMGNRQYVAIDGKPCIDEGNFWLPPTSSALVHLEAGEHQVQVICKSSNTPMVSWARVNNVTTFRSPNAKLLDYTVFYGPSADSVIATYRNLSGNVPMLPRWSYGFWQCRERYTSGKNLVETVEEFRKRNIPMDVIVQDWQYWGNNGWGVPQFDTANYSDPAGFIKKLHNLDAHFNISIWSNPDKNSVIGKEFASKELYVPDTKWLDYFNPVTREAYWNTLNENLFTYGVDSWWMDATEPENDALHGSRTYLGLGDFYRLTYPLFVSRAVYEGQRETTSDKRVCILTRSAFLGQQRYGTINWSGDIGGNWDSYRRQIVAGLDYTMTGMPYWTTDIGGFFRLGPAQYTDEQYHELLTRWYQWGAFNPIFRIHGYQSETEPWKYGQRVEENMRKMLGLRYRLLPYIYSEAWRVTRYGSTMMRPLVMDFRRDTVALNQQFEYMFGTAFLVAPVTEPNAHEWNVYLPESVTWYDFWTGKRFDGGLTPDIAAPLDRIPLMVKAGSIIPMGPFIQYSAEKSNPVEIRIYPGANGEFTLYEDENDGYDYEKGLYSTIEFRWNDSVRTLTIGKRRGDFPGMLKTRKFNVVVVSPDHGTGVGVTGKVEKVVQYVGTETTILTH